MRRILALLLLVAALAPVTWIRAHVPLGDKALTLQITPVPVGNGRDSSADLGAFRLDGAWQLESQLAGFGGYSSLVNLGDGRLLAVSDNGSTMTFSVPDSPDPVRPQADVPLKGVRAIRVQDLESTTTDLPTGTAWLGLESENAILRFRLKGGSLTYENIVRPKGMVGWGVNSGPESLVRLHDGHFLTLREGFVSLTDRRRHQAIRFRGDPLDFPDGDEFTMTGPADFRPTDALQMPDGRVLVLFRKVLWPLPARFAGALAIGDPEAIRPGHDWPLKTVATWGSELPSDNYEAIAIAKGKGTDLTLWMMSDDNGAAFQRTLLLKWTFDPANIPD